MDKTNDLSAKVVLTSRSELQLRMNSGKAVHTGHSAGSRFAQIALRSVQSECTRPRMQLQHIRHVSLQKSSGDFLNIHEIRSKTRLFRNSSIAFFFSIWYNESVIGEQASRRRII